MIEICGGVKIGQRYKSDPDKFYLYIEDIAKIGFYMYSGRIDYAKGVIQVE